MNLPVTTGIGLRAPHYREVLALGTPPGWVEVHSENFFDGGQPVAMLQEVARRCPVSLHGVGLGLGNAQPPDAEHLAALVRLERAIGPAAVSEHLSFNRGPHGVVNDQLPVPHTQDALTRIADNVARAQDALGRQILLENLSSCIACPLDEMDEGTFLARLVTLTGCGILLDVNNLYVNQQNLGVDVMAFLDALPADAIREIHLAGHSRRGTLLVDTHDAPVPGPVWSLYRHVLERFGPRPTLIEWDQAIPPLAVLLGEAATANRHLEAAHARHA